jgi:DNA-binding transcriptional regulator YbjK
MRTLANAATPHRRFAAFQGIPVRIVTGAVKNIDRMVKKCIACGAEINREDQG